MEPRDSIVSRIAVTAKEENDEIGEEYQEETPQE